jgi:hypothetical protein
MFCVNTEYQKYCYANPPTYQDAELPKSELPKPASLSVKRSQPTFGIRSQPETDAFLNALREPMPGELRPAVGEILDLDEGQVIFFRGRGEGPTGPQPYTVMALKS